MILILLAYWMATTVYGVYWLIKNPASRFASDTHDEYVTLLEVMGKLFPAASLAWLFVPLFLMSRIRFKRSRL
jgi:hypothetical protein